jgi:zinc protease
VSLARQEYGSWKKGTSKIEIPAEPEQTEERTARLRWPAPTLPTVVLAYHIPAADPRNPDTAALGALAQAVFGETSPLYKALVLVEQKVERLDAEAEQKRDPGLFIVRTRVRKASDVSAVRTRIEGALADAALQPVDPARLAAIKSHLRYGFAAALDSPDTVAHVAGESIAITGRPDAMNDLYAAYDRLTPADLQRVARSYFAATNRTVITLETEKTP